MSGRSQSAVSRSLRRPSGRCAVAKAKGILGDQTRGMVTPLHIALWDGEVDECCVFRANNIHCAAVIIGAIYKLRGQIEMFFRCVKQGLEVKVSLGTSASKITMTPKFWLVARVCLRLADLRFAGRRRDRSEQLLRAFQVNLFEGRTLLTASRRSA